MEIKINSDELDDFNKKLEDLGDSVEVSTDVLMTDDFIQRNSTFDNWEAFMDAGGVNSDEDIESEEFSAFIANNTQFADFEEMAEQAAAEYIENQLR